MLRNKKLKFINMCIKVLGLEASRNYSKITGKKQEI
jgi:hypothetical protein